jgi:site-specific recombinase XerD
MGNPRPDEGSGPPLLLLIHNGRRKAMKKQPNSTLGPILESFFYQHLANQKGVSTHTIAAYRDALRLLVRFASDRLRKKPARLVLSDLDRDLILAFLDQLETDRGNSVRTRNARLTAIHSFFRHVTYQDPAFICLAQTILAIETKRTVKPLMGYLTRKELDAILATPNRSTSKGRRDYALLLFLARTGARVSEAITIDRKDLRLETPPHVRLRGKGAKERIVPLAQDIQEILRFLCDERGLSSNATEPVFVNSRGKRLSRYGVRHILRRTVAKAICILPQLQERAVTPHTLRHTLAMHLLQSGVDLVVIQMWLGHEHLRTVHQYVEADLEMKRKSLNLCEVTTPESCAYKPDDTLLAFLDSL